MKKKYLTILQNVDRITVSAGNRRYNTEQSETGRIPFTESVGFGFFGFINGTSVISDAETPLLFGLRLYCKNKKAIIRL